MIIKSSFHYIFYNAIIAAPQVGNKGTHAANPPFQIQVATFCSSYIGLIICFTYLSILSKVNVLSHKLVKSFAIPQNKDYIFTFIISLN